MIVMIQNSFKMIIITMILNSSNNKYIREELYDPMHYEICFSDHRAVHLKHLIMTDFDGDLNARINFVKNLTTSADKHSIMIDASH